MKKMISMALLCSFLISNVAKAEVSYPCAKAYENVYAKTLAKNKSEANDDVISKTGIVTGGALGLGYWGAVIAVIGAPAIAMGAFGVVALGFGGYEAGKFTTKILRSLKGNPYHKANQAIVYSLTPESEIDQTRKNQVQVLTEKLNQSGSEVSYEKVKAMIAELAQTDAFCPNGEAVKFGEMKRIIQNHL